MRKPIFLCERPLSPATTCFWHQSLLRRRRAKSAEGMVVRCTALFALFFSRSDGAWNVACVSVCICIRRSMGNTGFGNQSIISGRGSGYCFICLVFDLAKVQMPERKAKQFPEVEVEPKGILQDGSPPSSKSARMESQGRCIGPR